MLLTMLGDTVHEKFDKISLCADNSNGIVEVAQMEYAGCLAQKMMMMNPYAEKLPQEWICGCHTSSAVETTSARTVLAHPAVVVFPCPVLSCGNIAFIRLAETHGSSRNSGYTVETSSRHSYTSFWEPQDGMNRLMHTYAAPTNTAALRTSALETETGVEMMSSINDWHQHISPMWRKRILVA